MDTHVFSREIFRYIVLIPHPQALGSFRQYREKLFAGGFYGAHSLPLSAALAELSRPFKHSELKELAANIRYLSNKTDGKILGSRTETIHCPGRLSFFGTLLELPWETDMFPPAARGKIIGTFLPPVLCSALVYPGTEEQAPMEESPALSFRAAYIANMSVRPIDGKNPLNRAYSFEWETGHPVWLPAYRKKTEH